jgi:rhodanese-related sulfurtransferase
MGTLQAHLALALLLRWQPTVLGQLITVDFRTLRTGGFSFARAQEPTGASLHFIAPSQVSGGDVVIDLRSLAEAPVSPFAAAIRIGVEALEKGEMRLPREPRIVLCCRTGVRAWRAARALASRGHTNLALIALGE